MPRVAAAEQAPTEGRPGPKSRANAGRDAAATLDSDDDERLAHPSWSVSSLAGIGDTRVGSSTGRCLPEAVPTSFSASRAKFYDPFGQQHSSQASRHADLSIASRQHA